MISIDLNKKQIEEIVNEYLSDLSPKKLDSLFAEQIAEFHDADKQFPKVREAILNPMRVS